MKSLKLNLAITLSMVVAGMVVESACAQGRGGFGRGMFGGGGGGGDVSEVSLLSMEEVLDHLQDDYELSDDARKEILANAGDAQDELGEERRAIMGDMRNMDQDERAAAMEATTKPKSQGVAGLRLELKTGIIDGQLRQRVSQV